MYDINTAQAVFEGCALVLKNCWDTRSVALFLNGLSKLAWIIGVSLAVVVATGFTTYIVVMYLMSFACFFACPCIGLGMAAGTTVLWGVLFVLALQILLYTWTIATVLALLAPLFLVLDKTDIKSVALYSMLHLCVLAASFSTPIPEQMLKDHFFNNKPVGTSDKIFTEAKDPVSRSSQANFSAPLRLEENLVSALSLETAEKTNWFIGTAKEDTAYVRAQKLNSYFVQFGAFNTARECFDYQNDFLRNLETLYVRSESPRFLRIPIVTKDRKPAIAIVFGPFESMDDAKNEISQEGVVPPKYWVRSTNSLQGALLNF
jgi:hypothetical protein